MRATSTGSSSSPERPRPVPGARAAEVRALLDRLGVAPRRRLGQSFLIDPFVADAEVALLGLRPGEPVLEIGAGLGLLTEAILRRGFGPLTVIERDRRLAEHLRSTLPGRAHVLEGDALLVPLPEVRAAIGNLPYASATAMLARLFEAGIPRVVAMLQREVAERYAAVPGTGAYGRLTIRTAALGRIELFRTVGPEAFYPAPSVESRILAFTAHPAPVLGVPIGVLEAAIDPLFASRRKQLGNLLPRLGPRSAGAATSAGWPSDWPRRRPEELDPEAFFRFAEALHGAPPPRPMSGPLDGRRAPGTPGDAAR